MHHKKFHYSFNLALILILLLFISGVFWQVKYTYKIYPHIFIGNKSIAVGGLTKGQALEIITQQTDTFLSNSLNFVYQNKKIDVSPVITGPSGDDAYGEVYSFDVRQSTNKAYDYGRTGSLQQKIEDRINSLHTEHVIPLATKLNRQNLENILKDNFKEFEKPAQSASLDIKNKDENLIINIKDSVLGQGFDYQQALIEAENKLINLDNSNIELKTKLIEPELQRKELETIIPQIKEIIRLTPITLSFGEKKWQLEQAELIKWFKPLKNQSQTILSLNTEQATKFLETIGTEINVEALNAKFEIIDGRVSQFQASKNGLVLNITKTIKLLTEKLIQEKTNTTNVIVDETKPLITNDNVNDLGIVELVGRGISDFAKSPKNRIHNIKTGAAALNGLLIKPGETFSLLTALGEIDGAHGYLQELVIKGNKTTPEFGGGLCQIGTTTFRAALQSGLPIIERRNHSYNVVYYSPTGTDATIYNPNPDFKFLNDTSKHLLFLTKVEDTKVVFELWGTKDGRTAKFIGKEETDDVTKLTPIISKVIKPGAPKIIETDTLKPGVKKKLESSHTGANATFDYIITYPDGQQQKKTFSSHYIPWREVWLIGVEKTVETTTAPAIEQIKPNDSL